jgi:hypothetical protein
MLIAPLAKRNASFATAHALGEVIEYRTFPYPDFVTVDAVVERRPIDSLQGGWLKNTIHLRISKTDVPTVNVGKDEVRVDGHEYRVQLVLESSPGFFKMEAIQ